jgi:hypothetical protein
MVSRTPPPDPLVWAAKLRLAAAELRLKANLMPNAASLARRLECHADAILFPHLPRWWAEQSQSTAAHATAATGDD